jgi:hypothetical protein
MSILGLGVSVKAPNVDAVLLSAADDSVVIDRAEHNGFQWVSMTDKCLEIKRNILLSFIVPDFNHAVFSSGQHVSTVV